MNKKMSNCLKIATLCIIMIIGFNKTSFGQTHIFLDSALTLIPEGETTEENDIIHQIANSHGIATASRYSAPLSIPASLTYKWGKVEYYNKDSESDPWNFNYATYRNFNDIGLLIKTWDEGQQWTKDNNYSIYYYDDKNRTIKIEHYWDSDGISLQAYHTIEYFLTSSLRHPKHQSGQKAASVTFARESEALYG